MKIFLLYQHEDKDAGNLFQHKLIVTHEDAYSDIEFIIIEVCLKQGKKQQEGNFFTAHRKKFKVKLVRTTSFNVSK